MEKIGMGLTNAPISSALVGQHKTMESLEAEIERLRGELAYYKNVAEKMANGTAQVSARVPTQMRNPFA